MPNIWLVSHAAFIVVRDVTRMRMRTAAGASVRPSLALSAKHRVG
ncbi:hypothetical protein ACFLSW_01855 [Candidatus Bipolaricaulota bacterium]